MRVVHHLGARAQRFGTRLVLHGLVRMGPCGRLLIH